MAISPTNNAGTITVREHIATQVLAGLAALPATGGAYSHKDRADKAVRMADALIIALNKEPSDDLG